MFKAGSPQELEFTIDGNVILRASEDGSFYDGVGRKLNNYDVYTVFSKWVKRFGKDQLGWANNTITCKCDCGGEKSRTTHSSWCSINYKV